MPCAMPPCTWPSTIIGLITVPKSSTAVQPTISVLPVSLVDLDLADVAAGRERKVGRIVERAFLQSGLKLGAGEFVRDIGVERRHRPRPADLSVPATVNLPSLNTMSPSAASSMMARRPSWPWPRPCRAP
mgnify:CR=1 FL=1